MPNRSTGLDNLYIFLFESDSMAFFRFKAFAVAMRHERLYEPDVFVDLVFGHKMLIGLVK